MIIYCNGTLGYNRISIYFFFFIKFPNYILEKEIVLLRGGGDKGGKKILLKMIQNSNFIP